MKRRKEEQALYKKACAAALASFQYYPKYTWNTDSIVRALQDLKIDSNINFRKKIGAANGINNVGTAEGNTRMLILLKQGKLKKA